VIRAIALVACWFFAMPASAVNSVALNAALADLNSMDDAIHALIAECPAAPTYHSRIGEE
jgi:hypothetical protein